MEICRIPEVSNAQLKSPSSTAQTQSQDLHVVRTGTVHRQKASVRSDSFACTRDDNAQPGVNNAIRAVVAITLLRCTKSGRN